MHTQRLAGTSSNGSMPPFMLPPEKKTSAGQLRRVGVQLEIPGFSLDEASELVAASLDATVISDSHTEHRILSEQMGEIAIEIDWPAIKGRTQHSEGSYDEVLTSRVRELAKGLVPVEVVCPPLAVSELEVAETVLTAFREARLGEEVSSAPFATYDVHITTEVPSKDSSTLHRYLRAYCLLQWWLEREHARDEAGGIDAAAHSYPTPYLHAIHHLSSPSVDDLREQYLDHNGTRECGLDMMSLLAEREEAGASDAVIDRGNIPSAFRYRVANCSLGEGGCALSQSWNLWCVVESLANDEQAIGALAAEFELDFRQAIGVDKTAWVERVERWVQERDFKAAPSQ